MNAIGRFFGGIFRWFFSLILALIFHGWPMMLAILVAAFAPQMLGNTLWQIDPDIPGFTVQSVLTSLNVFTVIIALTLSALRHEKGSKFYLDAIANVFWTFVGAILAVLAIFGIGITALAPWLLEMAAVQAAGIIGGIIIGQTSANRTASFTGGVPAG